MENTINQTKYASFLRRMAAVFIDGLILLIPSMAMAAILPYVGGVVLWLLYSPLFECSALQGTPGKKVMGIRIVDSKGNTISFSTAILRSLVKLAEGVLLCIPYLLALFTERKQTLHDLVADSVVIEGAPQIPVVDAWVQSFQTVFGFQKSPSSISVSVSTQTKADALTSLERLTALYEKGALSKEEFEAEKKKILN